MERGVTFLMLMIEATQVLTLTWLNARRARLLFSMMSAPSPSPSASLAEDGDVNMALKAWRRDIFEYIITARIPGTDLDQDLGHEEAFLEIATAE